MHESEKWKWSRSVVSDSSRPHGLQPTRLLHPWDFPGKSTGVGCHWEIKCLALDFFCCCYFFWCGPFKKSLLNLLQHCFLSPEAGIKLPALALEGEVLTLNCQGSPLLKILNRPSINFPHGAVAKNSPANAGDVGLIPGLGRSPGEGNSNPLQYPCLKISMDRGAWWATVHGVIKSWTRLSN